MRRDLKNGKKRFAPKPGKIQAPPKYAIRKKSAVVLVRPRDPGVWKKDPRLHGVESVDNDIKRLQQEEARALIIANADSFRSARVTVGRL